MLAYSSFLTQDQIEDHSSTLLASARPESIPATETGPEMTAPSVTYVAYAPATADANAPFGALFGALIFGLGTAIQPLLSMFRPDIPSQFPQMIPYVLTIIVVAGVVGRVTPPAADGKPYTKE